METYYLTCRSLTYAQRVSGALSAARIKNMLVRTMPKMSREGCGYAVRVDARFLGDALGTLSAEGLPPKKVYRLRPGGGYEEVAW